MNLARQNRTDAELCSAAGHVNYEIAMLIHTAEHLGGWHSSPISTPVDNETNEALESFLLHFRNLRAFLCPSLQMTKADDILASDFLREPKPRDIGRAANFGRTKSALTRCSHT